MSAITLDELKEIELNILQEVHLFCEKNHLRYFLAYGTLLGAIRHHGFIPWDDDIDIYMPRDDYKRFLHLMAKQSISHLTLLSPKTTPGYFYPFAKVIDSRTILYENKLPNPKVNLGVYIDVFPLSYMPTRPWLANLYCRWMRLLSRLLWRRIILFTQNTYTPINVVHFSYFIISLIPIRLLAAIYAHSLLLFPPGKSRFIADFGTCYNERIQFPRIWMQDTCPVTFEGHLFYAMKSYHSVLTTLYGNYMQLPPPNQRIPKHDFNVRWK